MITKNRLFAGLIVAVFLFAVLSLGILVALAFWGKEPPTQQQTKLGDLCHFIITTTIGALVGLLGGRAASPDTLELEDKKPV